MAGVIEDAILGVGVGAGSCVGVGIIDVEARVGLGSEVSLIGGDVGGGGIRGVDEGVEVGEPPSETVPLVADSLPLIPVAHQSQSKQLRW